MKNQFVDFEGNFGSQDPALQPTEEEFARLSEYLKAHRAQNEKLIADARQVATKQPAKIHRKAAA
ncbi:hypothetical protein [Hymenobacter sp. UYCo722]|uniref:hypothetical protein n=1 Tax=Hymenobacter sp. UYCo722 TaxID=3156335 RepID=UPI003391CDC9